MARYKSLIRPLAGSKSRPRPVPIARKAPTRYSYGFSSWTEYGYKRYFNPYQPGSYPQGFDAMDYSTWPDWYDRNDPTTWYTYQETAPVKPTWLGTGQKAMVNVQLEHADRWPLGFHLCDANTQPSWMNVGNDTTWYFYFPSKGTQGSKIAWATSGTKRYFNIHDRNTWPAGFDPWDNTTWPSWFVPSTRTSWYTFEASGNPAPIWATSGNKVFFNWKYSSSWPPGFIYGASSTYMPWFSSSNISTWYYFVSGTPKKPYWLTSGSKTYISAIDQDYDWPMGFHPLDANSWPSWYRSDNMMTWYYYG